MSTKNQKPNTFAECKGILIEPAKGRISEISIKGGFPALYEIIGCQMVESIRSPWQLKGNNEMMYLDEEARLKKVEFGFQHSLVNVDQFNFPFLGNAVILGRNWNTGEDIDTQLEASYIGNLIRFYKIEL